MKYNKSEIMKKAWELRKGILHPSMSDALKMAWASAKAKVHVEEMQAAAKAEAEAAEQVAQEEKAHKAETLANLSEDTKIEKMLAAGGKRWTKAGKDRIYLRRAISKKYQNTFSRKMCGIMDTVLDKAYYDVCTGVLVYDVTKYDFVAEYMEENFFQLLTA